MNDNLIDLLTFFSFHFSRQNLQDGLRNIEGCCTKISLMADQIKQQLGIDAQAILPDKLYLQRSSCLEKMMQGKLDELEVFPF